jgi:hypothetical protein
MSSVSAAIPPLLVVGAFRAESNKNCSIFARKTLPTSSFSSFTIISRILLTMTALLLLPAVLKHTSSLEEEAEAVAKGHQQQTMMEEVCPSESRKIPLSLGVLLPESYMKRVRGYSP